MCRERRHRECSRPPETGDSRELPPHCFPLGLVEKKAKFHEIISLSLRLQVLTCHIRQEGVEITNIHCNTVEFSLSQFHGFYSSVKIKFQGFYSSVKIKFQGFYSSIKIKLQGFYSSVKIKFQGFYSSIKIKFQGFYSSVKIKFQGFYSSVKIKFQGFYSSVKIKFQGSTAQSRSNSRVSQLSQDQILGFLQLSQDLNSRVSTAQSRSNSRSIQGVFQESHFGQNSFIWVYTDIGYDDKNFIILDYCNQQLWSMHDSVFQNSC